MSDTCHSQRLKGDAIYRKLKYKASDPIVKAAFSIPKTEIEKAEQQESKKVPPPAPYQKK